MIFDITIRYGTRHQRYHTLNLEVSGMAEALERAAAELPPEILAEADIVEIRKGVDPERREYVEEG